MTTNGKWQPADVLVTFSDIERGETSVVATTGEQILDCRIEDHPALAARYRKGAKLTVVEDQSTLRQECAPIPSKWIQPGIGKATSLQSRLIYLARAFYQLDEDRRQGRDKRA